MLRLVDKPYLVFGVSLVAQLGAAYLGDLWRRKVHAVPKEERADFDIVASATLTLLALIIGFSFSMAVSRYDQRKNFEEAEANAIGTEYVRADLLPAEGRMQVRGLLGQYLDERVRYYNTDRSELRPNSAESLTQAQLWSAVVNAASPQPTAVVALAISGMNDVLNSQGYTQAAWLNRIPTAAWALLGSIAVFANFLLGYRERRTDMRILLVLPLTVSIALFLIADIDSPHSGLIRVVPQNLTSLSPVLHTP